MNILIIGNGFDLAHGLPTGYKDFLDCCKRIVLLFGPCANGKIGKDVLIDSNMNPLLKERIEYIYENGTVIVGTSPDHPYQTYTIDSTFDKPLNEMYECIKENIWYKLFIEKIDLNNTWIDFEKEISLSLIHISFINSAISHVHSVPSSVIMVRMPSSESENETGIFSIFKSHVNVVPSSCFAVIIPLSVSIVRLAIILFAVAIFSF